ncbi:MAG TPA: FMN-binding negative transcriptional regulator [Candidatus Sulfotelmatobacter sp.]|nr:FMN-binding negative transcriptional regulator [Candidatus Sulfotelmatobacter sp.]
MYVPKHFAEQDATLLREAIARYPLATLVTAYEAAPVANHLPMLVDPERPDVLLCHVARANALWRTVDQRSEALAIFTGPDAYVSPAFYPAKREHGRVVPTWNYIAVHVYGTLHVLDDLAATRRIVTLLTDAHEAPRAQPWHVDDAPETFVEQQLGAIVGLELHVARAIGKWKLGQNRSTADRLGVEDALSASDRPSDRATADAMAERAARDAKPAD